MKKLQIELSARQHKVAQEYAKLHGTSIETAVVKIWWGRVCALSKYRQRIHQAHAKFRPYAPRQMDERVRRRIKRTAVRAGIAPVNGVRS